MAWPPIWFLTLSSFSQHQLLSVLAYFHTFISNLLVQSGLRFPRSQRIPDSLEACHSWNSGLLRSQLPVPSKRPKEVALWLSSYAIVEIQLRISLLLWSEMVSAKPIPKVPHEKDPGITFQMFVHPLNSLICSDNRFADEIEHLPHFAYPVLSTQCQFYVEVLTIV